MFVQLRALFKTIDFELNTHMDLVAEHIVVLGEVALGTVHIAVTQSSLPEYPRDISAGNAHVLALAERVAHYATAIRAALEHATNVEDGATTNIHINISCGIETQ